MAKINPSSSLPPIKVLFTDSWTMFKGSLLHVFLLNLIGFGIFASLFIIALIIAIPLGIMSVLAVIQPNGFNPLAIFSFGALGILILFLIIVCAIVGLAIQTATILIVSNYKKDLALSQTLKRGFHLVLPLLGASFLTGLITTGGFFLLLIPGIVLSVLFSFTAYEIVISENSVLGAIRRSIMIVKSNFWGILGRMLLWAFIVIVVVNIPNFFNALGKNYNASVGLIGFVLQILVSWFGISYSVTLYKQAQVGAQDGSGKLMFPIILSIVGWVVGLVMFISLAALIIFAISNLMQNSKNTLNPYFKVPNRNNMKNVVPLSPTATSTPTLPPRIRY